MSIVFLSLGLGAGIFLIAMTLNVLMCVLTEDDDDTKFDDRRS